MKQILEDSKEAYQYLTQGYILIALETKTILYKKNDTFYARNSHWHSVINEHDFLDLFRNCTFQVYETKEEEISTLKDEEYYRWRHKYL